MKYLEKEVAEYKIKADISQELMVLQTQCGNTAAELFRTKNGFDDISAKLEEVKKENLLSIGPLLHERVVTYSGGMAMAYG